LSAWTPSYQHIDLEEETNRRKIAYTKFYCEDNHKLSDRCHLFYMIVDTTSEVRNWQCLQSTIDLYKISGKPLSTLSGIMRSGSISRGD
jgi:hypothetical protein